jgi:hypothetical protein
MATDQNGSIRENPYQSVESVYHQLHFASHLEISGPARFATVNNGHATSHKSF